MADQYINIEFYLPVKCIINIKHCDINYYSTLILI